MFNGVRLAVGLFGVFELLFPRTVVRLATAAMYRGESPGEPRDWVYTAARVEGAILATVGLVSLYRAANVTDDDGTETDEGNSED